MSESSKVRIATSLGRSGLQEWLLQRITAILLILYILFWVVFYVKTPNVSYQVWHTLFTAELLTSDLLRFFSLIVLISLLIHAWIGIWTVTTDYVKILALRLLLQSFFGLGLLLSLIWGIVILWSR